jgi:hypothetical protein
MYGHDVGPAEQLVLCDKGRSRGLRGLGRQQRARLQTPQKTNPVSFYSILGLHPGNVG